MPSKPEQRLKHYTPKSAVRAMLAGKILFNQDEQICFWSDDFNSFMAKNPKIKNEQYAGFSLGNFTGLFEILRS
jgi:hypothetical protein